MRLSRRQLAKGFGAAALARLAPSAASAPIPPPLRLPARSEFLAPSFEVCLNNARWHPISKGATQAIERYLAYKSRGIWNPPDESSNMQRDVKSSFAQLIHAQPSEIAYVNSTTAAENLLVAALDLPRSGGNIVTDALHFEGSLYLYESLRRQGVDVRIVKPRDWSIHPDDLAAAIDKNTRLVAVSLVSYINGFQHDMKHICALAHGRGALVYADAVQAAGAIPIDVQASGVDALASASYKWLMGDMGIGFLYVRQDVLPRLKRPVFGFRQFGSFDYHAFPGDTPGTYPASWDQHEDTAGHFEIGTWSNTTIAALSFSLPYIRQLGVERIHAHSQSLLTCLQQELPRLGYPSITPPGSAGPIASFRVPDEAKTAAALKRANVDVSLSPGRMRISPSIYNDASDVDKLLAALA